MWMYLHPPWSLGWSDVQDKPTEELGIFRFSFLHFWAPLASERGFVTSGSPRGTHSSPSTTLRKLSPFMVLFSSKRLCNYICEGNPVGPYSNYSPQSLSAAFREIIFAINMGLLDCKKSEMPGHRQSQPPAGIHTPLCFLRKWSKGPSSLKPLPRDGPIPCMSELWIPKDLWEVPILLITLISS